MIWGKEGEYFHSFIIKEIVSGIKKGHHTVRNNMLIPKLYEARFEILRERLGGGERKKEIERKGSTEKFYT